MRRRLDPQQMFSNQYLDRIFNVLNQSSDKPTVAAEEKPKCSRNLLNDESFTSLDEKSSETVTEGKADDSETSTNSSLNSTLESNLDVSSLEDFHVSGFTEKNTEADQSSTLDMERISSAGDDDSVVVANVTTEGGDEPKDSTL